jgi:leader peptidase (prepilin peptidase)/N-methyltransferase
MLSGLMAWQFGWGLALAAALVFTWAVVSLAFIHFDTGELPSAITLPLVLAGLAFNLGGCFAQPGQAALGAMAGWVILGAIRLLAARRAGYDSLGRGSPLLGSAAGAFFGLAPLPWLLAFWAILVLTGRLILRRGPLPVGLCFAIASLSLLAWHWPAALPAAG